MAKTFDGPPTLERSGSEHRVGRLHPCFLRKRGLGRKWSSPCRRDGEVEKSVPSRAVTSELLLAMKKIREIREIRVRLKRIILSVEHESFETKQLIRVIRAIRVPKKIRNSRAEKYLLLWGIVTTDACNEEICVNLWDLWDIRINSSFERRPVQSDTAMRNNTTAGYPPILSKEKISVLRLSLYNPNNRTASTFYNTQSNYD